MTVGHSFISRSALFPDDTFVAIIKATGWPSPDDISQRDGVEYVHPVLIACAAYQLPRKFETRVAYRIGEGEGNEVRLKVPLDAKELRLARDEHQEHAQ